MMRKTLLAVWSAVGVTCSALGAPANHADELRALATVMAMAQTASDRCADILVSKSMLEKAPTFFRFTPADQETYRAAAVIEMKRLAATIDAAPSLKAWCDEAYRQYGPNGSVLPDLLFR